MQNGPQAGFDWRIWRRGGANLELILALLLLLFAAWYGSCRLGSESKAVSDDAYITFNYARNLAEGHGLRFNPTDAHPTPGYSSELHLVYAAAAISLGFDPLVATRALSLCSLLAIGVLLGLCGARVLHAPASSGLMVGASAAWGLMLMPETGQHLASGMETLLFALVHSAAFAWVSWASARDCRPGPVVASIGAIVLVGLVLARPEGWILALMYTAALVFARLPRAGLDSALRECAPVLTIAVLVVLGLFAWRLATFGHLLGNAYYVKSANAIFGSDGWPLAGLPEVTRFAILRLAPVVFVLGLAAAALAFEARVWVPTLVLLAPSLAVLVLYSRAIHHMAGAFRYEYPLMVPWFGAGVAAILALSMRSRTTYHALLVGVVFVVPALAAPVRPPLWDYLQHSRSNAIAWCDRRIADNALSRVGRDLERTALGPAASILVSSAGQIPWYSRFTAVDCFGLTDTKLAGREALEIEAVWRYIGDRNPDVVQSILPPLADLAGTRESDANFCSGIVQSILEGRGSGLFQRWNHERVVEMAFHEMRWVREHCLFGASYEVGGTQELRRWIFVYIRKDSPHREQLLRTLRESRRADKFSDLGQAFPFDPRRLTE